MDYALLGIIGQMLVSPVCTHTGFSTQTLELSQSLGEEPGEMFAYSNTRAAGINRDGSIELLDLRDGQRNTVRPAPGKRFAQVGFEKDGELTFLEYGKTGHGELKAVRLDGTVRVLVPKLVLPGAEASENANYARDARSHSSAVFWATTGKEGDSLYLQIQDGSGKTRQLMTLPVSTDPRRRDQVQYASNGNLLVLSELADRHSVLVVDPDSRNTFEVNLPKTRGAYDMLDSVKLTEEGNLAVTRSIRRDGEKVTKDVLSLHDRNGSILKQDSVTGLPGLSVTYTPLKSGGYAQVRGTEVKFFDKELRLQRAVQIGTDGVERNLAQFAELSDGRLALLSAKQTVGPSEGGVARVSSSDFKIDIVDRSGNRNTLAPKLAFEGLEALVPLPGGELGIHGYLNQNENGNWPTEFTVYDRNLNPRAKFVHDSLGPQKKDILGVLEGGRILMRERQSTGKDILKTYGLPAQGSSCASVSSATTKDHAPENASPGEAAGSGAGAAR